MDDAKLTKGRKHNDHFIDEESAKANGGFNDRRGMSAARPGGGSAAECAVALLGATTVQPTDAETTSSSDLRQLVCSLFVDSIIATVPKEQRHTSQKELVTLLQRLKIVSSDYFTDTFSSARRPLSALISKFVTQACQQEPTIAFAPNADTALSVNGFSLINSRYLNDFEEISRIGVGGFGKVFKVRSLIDNQLYAIKQIRFDNSSSESFAKVLSECRYHASLQNEHVVRYHNAWVEFESSLRPKTVGQQSKQKPLTIARNHSLQSIIAWDRDITVSRGAGRVFECSADGLISSSTTTPDSGSPPPAQKPNGSKFWQSRRVVTTADQLSRSASSDSGEEAISKRQTPHSSASSSSISVKFYLNAERSSDEEVKNEEDSVRFASESDERQAGEMVLWSDTWADSRRSGRKTRIQKSRSSPTFSDLPTVLRRGNVDLDFGVPVLYIQMELCSTTLEKYLLERKALNMKFNEATVFGLLSAIDFLHKNQLIHRDVKPSNVLLKRQNGRWCALLGDFGLTREVSRFAHVNPDANDFPATVATAGRCGEICRVHMPTDWSKLTGGIGTALYAAPEQIVSQDYGPSVDVYSAGIVFYELFQMFKTSMERVVALTKLRENGRPTEKFRLIWPEICVVIERMIPIEPASRWTAEQVLACLGASKGRHMAGDGQNGMNCDQSAVLAPDNGCLSPAVQCESGSLNSYERLNPQQVTMPTNSSSLVDSSLQLEELQQLRRHNAKLEAMVESLQTQLAVYKRKERDSSGLKTDGN